MTALAHQSDRARGVEPGAHRVGEGRLFAHRAVKPGTATRSEQGGEDVEHRGVGMPDVGHMPSEVEVCQFHRAFLPDLARGGLPGFGHHQGGRDRAGRAAGERRRHLLADRRRVEVAGHHHEAVVRRVLLGVVGGDVRGGQPVEDVRQADDGIAVGTPGVGGLEQAPAGEPARVVVAHRHLPADHVEFAGQFALREGGVLEDVGEDVHRHPGAGVRDVDPVHGPVEGRVGVHVAACRLDLLVDPPRAAGGGSLEEHVLQHMREARPQPAALVGAARPAPCLGAHHRGGAVRRQDQLQPVVEAYQFHAVGQRRKECGGVPGAGQGGVQFGQGAGRLGGRGTADNGKSRRCRVRDLPPGTHRS